MIEALYSWEKGAGGGIIPSCEEYRITKSQKLDALFPAHFGCYSRGYMVVLGACLMVAGWNSSGWYGREFNVCSIGPSGCRDGAVLYGIRLEWCYMQFWSSLAGVGCSTYIISNDWG